MGSNDTSRWSGWATLSWAQKNSRSNITRVVTAGKNIIRTLLISYHSNPNPNLIECDKHYSGIKTLIDVPHVLIVMSNIGYAVGLEKG